MTKIQNLKLTFYIERFIELNLKIISRPNIRVIPVQNNWRKFPMLKFEKLMTILAY